MIVYEPSGVVIRSPLPGAPSILSFGEENDEGVQECRIEAGGMGMIFVDPRGFDFGGVVTADGFVERSSRRLKENIRPINDARDDDTDTVILTLTDVYGGGCCCGGGYGGGYGGGCCWGGYGAYPGGGG